LTPTVSGTFVDTPFALRTREKAGFQSS